MLCYAIDDTHFSARGEGGDNYFRSADTTEGQHDGNFEHAYIDLGGLSVAELAAVVLCVTWVIGISRYLHLHCNPSRFQGYLSNQDEKRI